MVNENVFEETALEELPRKIVKMTPEQIELEKVPDCPDFTRAKNRLPSWDKYSQALSHTLWTVSTILVCI